MSTPRRVHLLGARGSLGAALAGRLSAESGVELEAWCGEGGERSYEAFVTEWRRRPDPGALVVFAGGRSSGNTVTWFAEHVSRTAAAVEAFDAAGWPARALVLSSAAELVSGSLYGLAKRTQRELVGTAGAAAGTRVLALRVHSVVPGARPTRGLHADLLRQFEAGGPVRVRHLGGARDYVLASQVACVFAACAASDTPWAGPAGRVVDVGCGAGLRVRDWLDAFAAVHGPRDVVVDDPDRTDPEVVADPGPLRDLLAGAGPAWLVEFEAESPTASRLAGIVAGWSRERAR